MNTRISRTAVFVAVPIVLAGLFAGCSSDDATGSDATTTTAAEMSASSTTGAPGTTAVAETTSAPATTGAGAAGTTTAPAAGAASSTTAKQAPAPTGDALKAVLDQKCAAFAKFLRGAPVNASDLKRSDESQGDCVWVGTGLAGNAFLEVHPRVAGSAKSEDREREAFCDDVARSTPTALVANSNQTKRIAEQVRGKLYYLRADPYGMATISAFAASKDAAGGVSIGCDATYSYVGRVYVTAVAGGNMNLASRAIVAAHRGV